MSVSRNRILAYFLAIAVFLQLFGITNIASVKTKNQNVNIGISDMSVSLAPPVNKPVYFGEKSGEFSSILSVVLNFFIGDLIQEIISRTDIYQEFYPVISSKIFEVYRE